MKETLKLRDMIDATDFFLPKHNFPIQFIGTIPVCEELYDKILTSRELDGTYKVAYNCYGTPKVVYYAGGYYEVLIKEEETN